MASVRWVYVVYILGPGLCYTLLWMSMVSAEWYFVVYILSPVHLVIEAYYVLFSVCIIFDTDKKCEP